jgi:MFS family permease
VGLSFVDATWQFLTLSAVLLPISVALSASLVANAVVSRWFVRRRGLALGLTAFGLGIAGAILPPIIAALMPDFGWRMIWRAAGIIIAVVLIPAALLVVRDRPDDRDGMHYLAAQNDARPNDGGGENSDLTWRDIIKRKNFWLLLAAYLPILGLYGGCSQNLAPIVVSRGLSTQAAGALLSVFSVSYVASTLCMGMLSDRFGNRLPLFGLALATSAGGLIFALGQNVVSLCIGIALAGLGGGIWPLLAAAAAVEFGAAAVGRAFGLLTLFVPVIVLAPFIVARFHEVTGSYVPGIAGLAALALLGGSGSLFMRERVSAIPIG